MWLREVTLSDAASQNPGEIEAAGASGVGIMQQAAHVIFEGASEGVWPPEEQREALSTEK